MTATFIQPINIFTGIRQQNVTFCLDISGSMYNTLTTIKEHLIQYLLEQSVLADFNVNRLFNLIAFSTEVYPWATSMVLWNKATVNNSLNWISDLETKTGTNTLDALLTAFQDERCHAVTLVTDDTSDQEPFTVLNQISLVSKGRPVHCIYVINGRQEDSSTIEFLQNIASITRGSLKIITCDRNGVEKITPICSYDIATSAHLANLSVNVNNHKNQLINAISLDGHSIQPVIQQNSLISPTIASNFVGQVYQHPLLNNGFHQTQTIVSPPQPVFSSFSPEKTIITQFPNFTYPKWLLEPSIYKYPSFLPRVHITKEGKIPSEAIAWSRYRPVKVLQDGKVIGLTTETLNLPIPNDIAFTREAGTLLVNRAVIARSSLDGFYYKGKVLSQVLAHRFMVQFGPNNHGKFKDCFYQDTAIYDIIHYEDTMCHPINNNDKVLALIDGAEKYAPAEVLEGFEKRGSSNEKETPDHPVVIRFANGKTRSCPPNEVIWLPDAMHDRIKFELNLPSTARKYLEEYNDDYPNKSLPGYPINIVQNSTECVVMPRMVYDIWPYFVPFYPLYSNILYPAINNNITKFSKISTPINTINTNMHTMTPNYYRQIRSNPASVNADCLNRSVVGTTLTPEELNLRIQDQIYQNRHLILSKQEPCMQKQIPAIPNRCKSSCTLRNSNHFDDYLETSQPPIIPNESCERNSDHYKKYQDLIQNLYNESRGIKQTYCQSDCNEIKRAKSVTFCPDAYLEVQNENCCEVNEIKKCKNNSKQSKCQEKLKNNAENRFGNPKVTVGLPEKRFYRPRSAFSNLNQSKIQEDFGTKENIQRANYAKKEKGTIERLLNEQKKQEKRENYRKHLSNQIQEFENRRTETNVQKSLDVARAKQEKYITNKNRIDSTKIDIEKKEQQKIDHLQNEASKRSATQALKIENNIRKEEQKLAFKKNEQDRQNAQYHNNLINEEMMRKSQQNLASKFHDKNRRIEAAREIKGQKAAKLEQNLKQANQDQLMVAFNN